MPLQVHWEGIKNFQTVAFEPYEIEKHGAEFSLEWASIEEFDGVKHVNNRVFRTLTVLCFQLDFGSITKKNLDEIWFRIELHEKLNGATWKENRNDVPLSKADVESCIGFHANVHTTTRAQSNKAIIETWADRRRGN